MLCVLNKTQRLSVMPAPMMRRTSNRLECFRSLAGRACCRNHGDIPKKSPAGLGNFEPCGRPAHQAVSLKAGERFDFALEKRAKLSLKRCDIAA